jgi:16S rRNA processing protein RimM
MRPTGRQPVVTPAPLNEGAVVELGRIVNCHGIRGEVRMLPHNPDSTALDAIEWVWLRTDGGAIERRRLLGQRRHKRFVLLRLDGCATANDAEALVGRAVCVPVAELAPCQPHEVYHIQLLGCTVQTEDGTPVGTVRDVFSTGSNDVCVVTDGTREHLIPLIADVIVRLDVAAAEIVIRPLPGLLDT